MGLSVVPYHHKEKQVQAVEITQYRRDVVVKTYSGSSSQGSTSKRGAVYELSDKSRRRFLFQLFNASCDWFAFGTLTYPGEFPTDGTIVREHRRQFGQWLTRQGLKFAMILEFQERGAPHLHFVVDAWLDKDQLSRKWYELVGSGDERHLRAGTRIEFCGKSEQAMAYMAAIYAAKKDKQKTVPQGYENVGRFWSTSRGLVKPVKQIISVPDKPTISKVRTLRKVCESGCKQKRVQPVKIDAQGNEKKRTRKVKRKVTPRNFRFGLSGFTVFKGSAVASRLLSGDGDSIPVSSPMISDYYSRLFGVPVVASRIEGTQVQDDFARSGTIKENKDTGAERE